MQLAPAWESAQKVWNSYFSYPEPTLCTNPQSIIDNKVQDHLGHVNLVKSHIVLNGPYISQNQLDSHMDLILAHELGHLLLAPRTPYSHSYFLFLCLERGLLFRQQMGLLANVYQDLLINWHLKAKKGCDMAPLLPFLLSATQDPFWQWIARTYELLWRQSSGTWAQGTIETLTEATARQLAHHIRKMKNDWLDNTHHFLDLAAPFLPAVPQKLALLGDVHTDFEKQGKGVSSYLRKIKTSTKEVIQPPMGITPQDHFEIMQELQTNQSQNKVVAQYYYDYAQDYLMEWPVVKSLSDDPLFEGYTQWGQGDPIQDIDWLESLMKSPVVIPGMTAQQRLKTTTPEYEYGPPEKVDIYIDGSGSMPNPAQGLSLFALISTIIALSALELDIPVRVTLWGTENDVKSSDWEFEIEPLLPFLTGYLGGMTAFPEKTLESRLEDHSLQTQIFIVSDQGLLQPETHHFFQKAPFLGLDPILLLSLLPEVSTQEWEDLKLKVLTILPEKLQYILFKVYQICTSTP